MHRIVCQILVASPSAADQNRIRRRKNSDPLRQIGCRFQKLLLFPEEFDPFRQLQLAGGGGSRGEKKLDSRVLLALRQFARLAGRADADPRMSCLCVCKTCRRRAIHFGKPCTRSLLVAALRGEPGRVSAPFRFNDAPRAGGLKSRKRKDLLARLISRGQALGFSRKGYVPCCQAIRSHCRVAFSPCPRVSVSPRLPVSLSPCLSP